MQNQRKKVIFKWVLLIFFIFIGVALTIYLIYIIPNQDLREIVTTIVAAIYGGFITLVGVAWTIKWTNETNQKNRKEQNKPLCYGIKLKDASNSISVQFQLNDEDQRYFGFKYIKNTDKVPFSIVSLKVNDTEYPCVLNNVIDKGQLFQLFIKAKKPENYNDCILKIKSIDGDIISYKLTLDSNNEFISNIEEIN